jgi:hypothetical protein
MTLLTFPDGAQIVVDKESAYQFRIIDDAIYLIKPDGMTYIVRSNRSGRSNKRTCNCKAFQFRGKCKHAQFVESQLEGVIG